MAHIKPLTLAIVIPVYNEEIYIGPCLDSIMLQSQQPTQVIVVDNNSTDKTLDIARTYPFVTILKEKKQGVGYARNTGFNAISADIIGRIDADTLLSPKWVENVTTKMTNSPNIMALSGPSGFYDLPFPRASYWATTAIRWLFFWCTPRGKRYLFGANMAVRRAAWNRVSKKICVLPGAHEDIDLSLHLEEAGLKVIFEPTLQVMISCRRADSTPRGAFEYAYMQVYTYKRHNIKRHGYMSAAVLLAVYPILHLLRRSFNPETRRLSLRYYLKTKHKPRPIPME